MQYKSYGIYRAAFHILASFFFGFNRVGHFVFFHYGNRNNNFVLELHLQFQKVAKLRLYSVHYCEPIILEPDFGIK